jgi:hypothetical protein
MHVSPLVDAHTSRAVSARRRPSEVDLSIARLLPILRNYTAEEIDAVRLRLEALLERRTPICEPPDGAPQS